MSANYGTLPEQDSGVVYTFSPTSDQEAERKKKRMYCYVGVGIALLVVAGVIVFLVEKKSSGDDDDSDYGGNTVSPNSGFSNMFTNKLVEVEKYMDLMMDPTADPCEDFVQYACGGWIDRVTLPAGAVEYNQMFNQINENNNIITQHIFDQRADKFEDMGKYWNMCNDLDGQVKAGIQYAFDSIFPAFEKEFKTTSEYLLATAGNGFVGTILFDVEITQLEQDPTFTYLAIEQDALTPDVVYADEFKQDNIDWVHSLLPNVGVHDSENKTIATAIMDLEYAINGVVFNQTLQAYTAATIKNVADWDWQAIFAPVFVDTTATNFTLLTQDGTFFSQVDALIQKLIDDKAFDVLTAWAKWRAYQNVAPLLAPEIRPDGPPDTGSFKRHPLSDLASPAAKARAKNYATRHAAAEREYRLTAGLLDVALGYTAGNAHVEVRRVMREYLSSATGIDAQRTVLVRGQRVSQFARTLNRYFAESAKKTKARTVTIDVWPQSSYKYFCSQILQTFFPDDVGQAYIDITWNDGTMDFLVDLLGRVRSTFRQHIQENQWMDNVTRARAVHKLDMITEKIAIPPPIDRTNLMPPKGDSGADWVHGLWRLTIFNWERHASRANKPTDRMLWYDPPDGSPLLLNAFYAPNSNSINLPAGLQQYKLLDPDLPVSFNFGGYGMVCGHEMTHGFDNSGRHYGPEGRPINWWTKESADAFEQRAQCFVDQYNKIPIPGTDGFCDGQLELGENIADNGGLRSSFYAMKGYLQEHPEHRTVLKDFSDEELYFISTSQNWCLAFDGPLVLQHIEDDVHAPGFARIIGPLQNSPEFAETFKCSANAYMNPKDKCFLW